MFYKEMRQITRHSWSPYDFFFSHFETEKYICIFCLFACNFSYVFLIEFTSWRTHFWHVLDFHIFCQFISSLSEYFCLKNSLSIVYEMSGCCAEFLLVLFHKIIYKYLLITNAVFCDDMDLLFQRFKRVIWTLYLKIPY